jgi:hypothetical protein
MVPLFWAAMVDAHGQAPLHLAGALVLLLRALDQGMRSGAVADTLTSSV